MKTKNYYKAYISGTKESKAFDFCYGTTAKSAIATIKRRNFPDYKDCYLWVAYIHDNGMEEQLHPSDYC